VLKIFDILGNEVKTLVNRVQASGIKRVVWDGKNSSGSGVGSGVFIYRLTVNRHTYSKKMVLLR